MEPWKDSCCSRKEASSKIGDPGDKTLGRVSKLCVKTLFISENFHA